MSGDRIAVRGHRRPTATTACTPRSGRPASRSSSTSCCTLDLAPAAATDDVADTVHYGELAQQVVAAIEGEPVDLVETLAQRVADLAPGVPAASTQVEVTVHKPEAPVGVPFEDVAVTIVRRPRMTEQVPPRRAVARQQPRRPPRAAAGRCRRAGRHPRADGGRGLAGLRDRPGRRAGPARLPQRRRRRRRPHSPRTLLERALAVEDAFDRVRDVRWGPRTLDVDVIAVGDLVVDEPDLQVPHPRAAERAFVLVPWLDVDAAARAARRRPGRRAARAARTAPAYAAAPDLVPRERCRPSRRPVRPTRVGTLVALLSATAAVPWGALQSSSDRGGTLPPLTWTAPAGHRAARGRRAR